MTDQISPGQFYQAEGVEDWRLTSEGATAFFRTRSFAESTRFVQAISELPGVEDHHPGVDLRPFPSLKPDKKSARFQADFLFYSLFGAPSFGKRKFYLGNREATLH